VAEVEEAGDDSASDVARGPGHCDLHILSILRGNNCSSISDRDLDDLIKEQCREKPTCRFVCTRPRSGGWDLLLWSSGGS
jgi:hypothetical protein